MVKHFLEVSGRFLFWVGGSIAFSLALRVLCGSWGEGGRELVLGVAVVVGVLAFFGRGGVSRMGYVL